MLEINDFSITLCYFIRHLVFTESVVNTLYPAGQTGLGLILYIDLRL